MMDCMVSIVVPVYNVEKYLKRCIDSILNQTFKDFELILVDDGSSDHSGQVCDEYAQTDKRIIVMHKENGGASTARNVGIDIACGQYIMFVDSDDYIEPEMIETHCNLMNLNVDLTVTSLEVISNRRKRKYDVPDKTYTVIEYLDDMSKEVFAELCSGSPCCKFFKKNILDEYSIRYNKDMSLGEDTCFNMEYLRHCQKIVTSSRVLYHYVKENEGSLFSKFQENTYINVKKAFECRMETLQQVGSSQETIDNFTKMYVEYMLANVVKSVKKGTRDQALAYMEQARYDEYLDRTIHQISIFKLYLLAKALDTNQCPNGMVYYIILAFCKIKALIQKKQR